MFQPMIDGRKVHDLRKHDRDFRVGDLVRLREFDPMLRRYTGRELTLEISYITSVDNPCAESRRALSAEYCILSYRPVSLDLRKS